MLIGVRVLFTVRHIMVALDTTRIRRLFAYLVAGHLYVNLHLLRLIILVSHIMTVMLTLFGVLCHLDTVALFLFKRPEGEGAHERWKWDIQTIITMFLSDLLL